MPRHAIDDINAAALSDIATWARARKRAETRREKNRAERHATNWATKEWAACADLLSEDGV